MFRSLVTCCFVLVCALLGACEAGPSLNEFYTDATVVRDDRIVGVWEQEFQNAAKPAKDRKEVPHRMTISPAASGRYLLSLTDQPRTPNAPGLQEPSFLVTLFKVGGSLFADITLSPELKDALEQTYPGMVIVTHRVMRIELLDDRVLTRATSEDFARHFTFAPIGRDKPKPATGITVTFSPTRVMTDTSEKLQQSLLRADAAGCFREESISYVRVKPQ
jgi:hypothetical protein